MSMKRNILAVALVVASALAVRAADLADGEYTGTGDGYDLTLKVSGDTAEITSTLYRKCSGGGTGQLSKLADGRWLITMTESGQCLVDVTWNNGSYLVEGRQGGECWQYSGQACSMSGSVSK